MICFEHPEMSAVGICKVCNKGLCRKCAEDLGHSLACAGACEIEAKQLNVQILQNRKSMSTGRASIYLWPLILFFMGGSILVNELLRYGMVFKWGTVFGGGILVFSIYMFVLYRKWGMDMASSEGND